MPCDTADKLWQVKMVAKNSCRQYNNWAHSKIIIDGKKEYKTKSQEKAVLILVDTRAGSTFNISNLYIRDSALYFKSTILLTNIVRSHMRDTKCAIPYVRHNHLLAGTPVQPL